MAKANFKHRYTHHTEVSIDEAMVAFKGRTELRMFMANKPVRFGIKFWARCDGRTSYMSDFQLYTGKRDTNDLQKQHGLGYRVVHDLSRDLVGLNHVLFFYRFFTGMQLMSDLERDGIYACATVMVNRKGTPPPLKCTKRLLRRKLPNRGDSLSFQKGPVTVTAWNDNNVVVIAHSNLENPAEQTTCDRRVANHVKIVNQPRAIQVYNSHMNGVDIHDQLREPYPAGRPSKKYWKYIMWFIVDCCQVNAWILWRECKGGNAGITHKDFVTQIGDCLVGNFSSRKLATIAEKSVAVVPNVFSVPHTWERLPGKKLRCKGCSKQKRRLETVYGCATCNQHLCDACFRDLHQ